MLLRYQLRTLFSLWHGVALLVLGATALIWPTAHPDEQAVLRWLLLRSEVFGPPLLMALASGLLLVQGRVEERWGAMPPGFPGLFRQRWLLLLGYFTLAVALFLALGGPRSGSAFPYLRTLGSTVVTATVFALVVPLIHTATGSAAFGWAAGMATYFITMTAAQFWYPYDSVYQLWLPFAGISDATPQQLLVSKGAYAVLALLLFWANLRWLERPERLLSRGE